MTGNQIFILLLIIIIVLAGAVVGLTLYFVTYKKKVHKQAQQNQIYLCKKMEVIVKMLAIIADPQRDRDTTIAECNKLAQEVVSSTIQIEQEIKKQELADETKNKELISQVIEIVKQIKKG